MDFEDKDLLFTTQHKNLVNASHAQFFQNKSSGAGQPIKTASKYFDRHAAALSSMTQHQDVLRTASDVSSQSHSASNTGSHQVPLPTSTKYATTSANNNNEVSKSKTKKDSSKEKSFFSKLHNSFSSHNIGSQSNNSGRSSPSMSSSSKNSFTKINSKIASLWKRSKSTHDKLDQDALTPNPGKNPKVTDLNRIAPARR